MSRKKRFLKVTLIVVAVLVVVRLILPYVVLHFANDRLTKIKGYYGHINDIDLALIRGAYKIDSIYINKVDSTTQKQTPFFSASLIDLSVEWKALFHGSVVGSAKFEHPKVRFTKEKVEPNDLKKDSSSFKDLKDDFMPLQINRLEINNGEIEYVDEFSKPKVDVLLTNARVIAKNLRNSYDSAALLPASLEAHANIYDGSLDLNMKLNPLANDPTFDLNTEIKDVNLVKLNDFFKAYAKIDVNKGTFGLYAEAAAKDGKFDGYVKPVIKDLDILGHEDRKDNIFQKMWEGFAGLIGQGFRNHPKDQVATKIPFRGNIKDPNSNIWYAISEILQNAFISAIQPSIDHEISIATVDTKKEEKKTLLEKVFGGKDKKNKSKKK
ncbi:MAG: DUF748 domain-containing protein [Bacteroidota bacterium]